MAAAQMGALVIFGATGDLAKLETFPALVDTSYPLLNACRPSGRLQGGASSV